MLFNDISKYIIENRERFQGLIYKVTKREFFASIMDRLMAEQGMLGDNK
jgi:hypothetical protein